MGIFAQIKDRRLFQIVASYLAAGWIGLEVVDQFVDRGVVPEMVYELVLIGYLCGIPAALLVGWFHGEKGEQRAPKSEIALLGALGVVFLVLSSFTVSDYRAEQMARQAALAEAGVNLRKIAVLYFRDYSPAAAHQHVADGLTEALIDELSAVAGLEVLSRNASAQFRGAELPRDSIGRALDAGTLVDGSIEERSGKLRITVRVFEGRTGNEFRATTLERAPEEVLTARDELVEDVARLLRSWLGEEVRVRSGGRRITNAEAWTLYQRGERARKDAEELLQRRDMGAAAAAFARADSLLAQAELLARDWADPVWLRGFIVYRKSRLSHDQERILALIEEGLGHAERALALEPNHARALELRGTLRYWKYLRLRRTLEREPRLELLRSARQDLDRAVQLEPTLASAHSTLSHLLYSEDISSAVLAAREAYRSDAYLEVAPDVLWRLTTGNYDLENLDQSMQWCQEGARRFAQDFRFSNCRLLLMTTRELDPDVPEAWRLAAEIDARVPPAGRAWESLRARILVGGVIARAARQGAAAPTLADSARAVLARASADITPAIDPGQELLPLAAYMYTLLGDDATAIQLLRRHAAANPRYSFEHHWWWRELRGKPEFQPLLADG